MNVIVAKMRTVVPGDFGFNVFADVGRVYLEGEESNTWHPSYGSGIFYSPFRRTSLYGVKFGTDDDRFFVVLEARMTGFEF